MKKILVCILFILGLLPVESKAQTLAVKSNLLYDVTTTMNLGLEVALSRKWTLDIPVNYNPWKFDDTRLKHWGIQPELRYWFCESFNRTFIGLHAHYADFNVGGWPEYALPRTPLWRRLFHRTFMDIEKTLEYRGFCRAGICAYFI